VYCISVRRRISSRWSMRSPRDHVQHHLEVLLGRAQAVDRRDRATMIASRRSSSALVADSRICSMCSLIELSFSMKVSDDGT
jgi:hypothetical protein